MFDSVYVVFEVFVVVDGYSGFEIFVVVDIFEVVIFSEAGSSATVDEFTEYSLLVFERVGSVSLYLSGDGSGEGFDEGRFPLNFHTSDWNAFG